MKASVPEPSIVSDFLWLTLEWFSENYWIERLKEEEESEYYYDDE